jgi:hypothetical protein
MNKQDQPQLPPATASRGRAADDRRASILLVEDDVEIADHTKSELEAFGYLVTRGYAPMAEERGLSLTVGAPPSVSVSAERDLVLRRFHRADEGRHGLGLSL